MTLTAALSATSNRWHSPVVKSVVMPAHAETTGGPGTTEGPDLRAWRYDNTGQVAQPVNPGDVASGSGPCGMIFGPTNPGGGIPGGTVVVMGCGGGPFQIVSWIVDGAEVVGAPVQFNGGTAPAACQQFLQNLANAMNAVDPHVSWVQDDDGIAPVDGGCSNHVRSSEPVDSVIYGPMVVQNTTNDDEWTLNPVII